ncbi:histidine phosphatase family protein [Planctomycetota bacterium]|nr:histidine phosphatase family protein [Planctomycetota bacterium]
MKDVFVVTHAEAAHHIEGLVGGWYDSELTDLGREQARAMGERLSELVGGRKVVIYSSDLKRAAQTAAIVAERFETTYTVSKSLREASYGVAEGKEQAWLDEHWVKTPEDNRLDHRNVEGGETLRELSERVYGFSGPRMFESQDEFVVFVSHGFASTFIIANWIGLRLEDVSHVHFNLSTASITQLHWDDHFRTRSVKRLNEVVL